MEYVDKVKAELGNKALHRQVAELEGTYAVRELSRPYAHGFAGKNDALRPDNTLPWNESAEERRLCVIRPAELTIYFGPKSRSLHLH